MESFIASIETYEEGNNNVNIITAGMKRRLGNDELLAKRYETALNLFNEAIRISPLDPALYLSRSGTFLMLSNYRAALSDALTAVNLNPNLKSAYVRVININITLGNTMEASEAIEKLALLDPNSEALNVLRKLIEYFNILEQELEKYCCIQSFEDIVRLCDELLSIATANLKFQFKKCESLLHLSKVKEATEIIDKLVLSEDEKQYPYYIYVIGLRYYYEDKIDRAKYYFNYLCIISDYILDIYRNCCRIIAVVQQGDQLIKQQKYNEANDIYSQIIDEVKLGPITKCKFLMLRAYLACTVKRIEQAIQDCNAILIIDKKYLDALLMRAACFETLEKYQECVRDYEAAYAIDSSWETLKKLCAVKKLQATDKKETFYEILGVHKSASHSEVKSAFKQFALAHHPDRHPNASPDELKEEENKFKIVLEAYETLSKRAKRMEYDEHSENI